MASFNKVILMGNLTRDVELRYTPSGAAVTEIGLAVNDRRKDANGQWVDETTFVDITLWGRTAEVCNEFLAKGSGVLIEGRLKLDQWDDKQTGQKRSKLRVTGERMQMLPRGETAVAVAVAVAVVVAEISKIPTQRLRLNHFNSSLKATKDHSNSNQNQNPCITHHHHRLRSMMISLFNVHIQTNFNLTLFH